MNRIYFTILVRIRKALHIYKDFLQTGELI